MYNEDTFYLEKMFKYIGSSSNLYLSKRKIALLDTNHFTLYSQKFP